MAVPKKRQSPSRRDKRRANHDRIDPPTLTLCPNCASPQLPHRICGSCGHYRGREVIQIKEE